MTRLLAGFFVLTLIMRWSKLKQLIEDGFADNIKENVQVHLTTYANSAGFMGRGWITFKGTEIANFSNSETVFKHDGSFSNILCGQWPASRSHQPIENSERHLDNLVEKGEFSKYDFGGSCYEFLKLSISNAQTNENPIIRLLAVLDKRTGVKSLKKLDILETHPLVRYAVSLRLNYLHS